MTRIRWEDAGNGESAGYPGTLDTAVFRIWTPEEGNGEWLLTAAMLPDAHGQRRYGSGPDVLKAEAERWLEEFVTSLGAVYDLASTYSPEVSACRFCNALLRQSQDGLYHDIDLNRVTNPEPWQCSGRYAASPGGRHRPVGKQP
jgi:hypothetical protein